MILFNQKIHLLLTMGALLFFAIMVLSIKDKKRTEFSLPEDRIFHAADAGKKVEIQ